MNEVGGLMNEVKKSLMIALTHLLHAFLNFWSGGQCDPPLCSVAGIQVHGTQIDVAGIEPNVGRFIVLSLIPH